ncbi:hypothetical protein MPSEU_000499000 [Mayamaea pseudoterrestris]|nr:hypothetical protein MPSEU_000499000 [Mayamaea pseudoterrestris]
MKALKRPRNANSNETRQATTCTDSSPTTTLRNDKAQPKDYGSHSESTTPTTLLHFQTFSTKEHASASITSLTETSDTVDLYSKFDELHTTLRAISSRPAVTSRHGNAQLGYRDDESLLSFGSFAEIAASPMQVHATKAVVDIPRRLLHSKGGEFKSINSLSSHASVFDRLYSDAIDRRRKDNFAQNRRSAVSIGASTITSRQDATSIANTSDTSSAFDRLYRNAIGRQRSQSRLKKDTDALHRSTSVLERRLQYRVPESALPRNYRHRRPLYEGPSSSSTRSLRTSASSHVATPKRYNMSMSTATISPTKSQMVSPTLTPAAKLNRRLQYKPPESALPKKLVPIAYTKPIFLSPLLQVTPETNSPDHLTDVSCDAPLSDKESEVLTYSSPLENEFDEALSGVLLSQAHAVNVSDAHLSFAFFEEAATIIASSWRTSRQRKLFQAKRLCASIIQFTYRAYCAKYSRCLDASLQAALECRNVADDFVQYAVNDTITTKDDGVVLIQKNWRMSRDRRVYLGKIASLVSIQSCWKGFAQRRLHVKIRNAVITMQHAFVSSQMRRDNAGRRRIMCRRIARAWRDSEVSLNDVGEELALNDIYTSNGSVVFDYVQRPEAISQERWSNRQLYVDSASTIERASSFSSSITTKSDQLTCASDAACHIQKWWRIQKAAGSDSHGGAATILQRAWRRSCARDNVTVRKTASTVIQSTYRMAFQKRRYSEVIDAVETIRLAWLNSQSSLRKRAAVVLIQRSWRCYNTHCRYQVYARASVILQTAWRRSRCREQNRGRSCCATLIQEAWRQSQARCRFFEARNAAAMIQSSFRLSLCRRRFEKYLVAVKKIQIFVRQLNARRAVRDTKLQRRAISAVVIQSAWRMALALKSLRTHRAAIILLQSALRNSLYKSMYREKRVAVIYVQKFFRKLRFCRIDEAAAIIQRTWRLVSAQRQFARSRIAAILLQSKVRATIGRLHFLELRVATVVLQCQYRQLAARRRLKAIQQERRTSATALVIQVTWRNYREVTNREASVVLIQRSWRSHLAQLNQSSEKWCKTRPPLYPSMSYPSAATVLQSMGRAASCRRQYLKQRTAILFIQCNIRKWYARTNLHKYMKSLLIEHRLASVVIQCAWRRSWASQQYNSYRLAAVIIQSLVRRSRTRTACRMLNEAVVTMQRKVRNDISRRHQTNRNAAITMQSAWRSAIARRNFIICRAAAIIIQSHGRQVVATHLCAGQKRWAQALHVVTTASAILIQMTWRTYHARHERTRCTAAIIMLQAVWRRAVERRRKWCATAIQATWRRSSALSSYLSARCKAIMIQSVFRKALAMRFYKTMLAHVIRRQRSWRRHVAFVKVRRTKNAAMLIQSIARMFLSHNRYLCALNAFVAIQCAVRQRAARRRLHFLKTGAAALTIQEQWRLCSSSRHRLRYSKKAAAIQAKWRCSAAKIHFRCIRACILIIQSNIRMRRQRNDFQVQLVAIIRLQSYFRKCIGSQIAKGLYHERLIQKAKAMAIERTWYIRKRRLSFQAREAATKIIQTWFRCVRVNKIFLVKKKAVHVLQKRFRSLLAMRVISRRHGGAVRIQRTIRGRSCRAKLASLALSCVKLQAFVRGITGRRRAHKQISAAICLQASWRGWHSRRQNAQCTYYSSAMHSELDRMTKAVILLQLFHHGSLNRSSSHFALLSINKYMRSPTAAAFICLSSRIKRFPPILTRWLDNIALAKQNAAVYIQRAYMRYLRRRETFSLLKTSRRRTQHVQPLAVGYSSTGLNSRSVVVQFTPVSGGAERAASVTLPHRDKRLNDRGVAISAVGELEERRLLVKFSRERFVQEDHATRVIQAFAKKVVREQAKRICKRFLCDLEESAQLKVARILAGTVDASSYGPCMERLARRARGALGLRGYDLQSRVLMDT